MGFGRAVTVQGLPPTLLIAFLAGRVAPRNIENPRQISAYLYPQTYGPRSPTFSRASLVRIRKNDVLFISGTASIVGHSTLHHGNVVAQTHETINNIKAVLDETNQSLLADQPKFNLSNLYYTVYVRRPADFCSVRTILTHCVGDEVKAVFLQADMCREDLLVEIEATGFL
jgi:enamine deaminase RidA (YjgF/YER057c/UK114 family)